METFSTIAGRIAEQGWAVTKEFLAKEHIDALAHEARTLWAQGGFRAAGIGRSADFRIRSDIRSDYILWLDENDPTPAQAKYLAAMQGLMRALNRELFAGLREFECHYAVYPPGAFYRKHLDRFSAADERIISSTLYLNTNWRKEDGGELRLYPPESDSGSFIDIRPQAGTLVLFRSDCVYHEVLPSAKERFSLTGWFRRRS
ncbi:MAG TPA: 2OG-Fe(II) oxygenase [Blastocatellia bacterium]|nr:2OG-Fe(II) oxygenase [Blastocatellia bacterium]